MFRKKKLSLKDLIRKSPCENCILSGYTEFCGATIHCPEDSDHNGGYLN